MEPPAADRRQPSIVATAPGKDREIEERGDQTRGENGGSAGEGGERRSGGVFRQRETDRGGDKISGGHGGAVRQTDGSVARRHSRR